MTSDKALTNLSKRCPKAFGKTRRIIQKAAKCLSTIGWTPTAATSPTT